VDLERRSLTLALGGGLVLILRASSSFAFAYGSGKLEIALYVASLIAIGLASVLAALILAPRIASKAVPDRFREPGALFELGIAAFALGVVLTTIQFAEVAIREFGDNSPFGD
jgi:hypothetical protein